MVAFRENPNHRRAKLVALTKRGRSTLDEINNRQELWVNSLARELPVRALRQMVSLAGRIQEELNNSE